MKSGQSAESFSLGIVWIYLFLCAKKGSGSSSGSSSSPPASIWGIAGEETGLPCNLTSPNPDDEVSLVLWYKDESTTPIYSLDTRRSTGKQAKHVAGEGLSSRAYLDTAVSPSLLKLNPALKEDEGEYKCRADFKNARTRYSSVTLRVLVLPKNPVISDEAGDILQSLIGPYNEGEQLKLICETEGGDPLPSLTWWRETVLLDDSYKHTPQGITRNELDIVSLQRHDLMAVLSCSANNTNFSSTPSGSGHHHPSNTPIPHVVSTVTVDLNFRPLEVRIELETGRALSAQKASELLCRSSGSRPPATVSWWKGNTKLKSLKERISPDGNTTLSVLLYVPSSEDNGERVQCRAENLLIPGSQLQDQIYLNVHYVPKVSLRLGNKLRHTHIQEGNDVYLECSVKANPWIGHVTWLFEGRELLTNTSAGIILSNHSLVLQNVQRNQRGRYVCKADNTEGQGISNTFLLRVQYSPICKADQKFRYGAAPRETIAVSCEVEADHPTVTFRWMFNHTSQSSETVPFVSDGTRSTATFHVQGDDHYGTLLCWATNAVGTQAAPCNFLIFQAGPPSPVSNCSASNQTENGFQVECLRGSNGSPPHSFLAEIYDNQFKKLRVNESAPNPIFVAKNLPAGTAFIVSISAVNSKGRSEAFVFQATTLAAPESLIRPSGVWQVTFSPVLIVLISVIAALVTVAFLFVLVIKVKERFRREQTVKTDKKEKPTCSTDVLLKKEGQEEVPYSCTRSNCQKCPDIISDFSRRDDLISRTNPYSEQQALDGQETTLRPLPSNRQPTDSYRVYVF